MAVKPLPVHGVDISHHQGGAIDFAGAKRRGLRWVYHKATEGDSFTDSNYVRRRAEAKKAGIPFGAYHFARPERGDAVAEARRFLTVAKPQPGDLRPALDLETDEGLSPQQIREWADLFCDTVAKAIGVQPVIYTPYDLGAAQMGRLRWRPRYNNTNTPPVLKWDIWQFSNGVFGVPNSLAGVGRVDLNVHREGLEVERLLIPQPRPEKKTRRLRMAVAPMQFSDNDAQTRSDFKTIFSRNYDVIFGTEAGPGSDSKPILEEEAKAAGYRVTKFSRYDTWVAVKASLIVKGTWETGAEHAIDRSSMHTPKPPGRWGDKAVVWASCEIEGLGRCTWGSVHPLTYGGAGLALKRKTDLEHAAVVAKFVKERGKGKNLVWVGGDWNLSDRKFDWTQGLWPGVSCWDEVKEWDNTGHGNIDGILRYQPDGRVLRWTSAEARDDVDLPLFTDHFLTEATCEVVLLAA